MKQEIIKVRDFILRPLKKEDAISLAKHANNKKVSKFLAPSFPSPYLLNHAEKFIELKIHETQKENPQFITFGIEIDNKIVGTVGIHLSRLNHSAELGFWLGEEYWGKKIMTKVIKEITKYCFDKLNLKRIEARVIQVNKASLSVLEKNKFKIEGVMEKSLFKNKKFYNLILMARIKK